MARVVVLQHCTFCINAASTYVASAYHRLQATAQQCTQRKAEQLEVTSKMIAELRNEIRATASASDCGACTSASQRDRERGFAHSINQGTSQATKTTNAPNAQERTYPNNNNPRRPPHDGGGLHPMNEGSRLRYPTER